MKLIEIVNVRGSLQKLVAQDLPLTKAWEIMKLTNTCNVHLEFYGMKRAKMGGRPDPDQMEALDNLEIQDIPTEKIRIPLLDNILLSASDIKALEPFVEFYAIQE